LSVSLFPRKPKTNESVEWPSMEVKCCESVLQRFVLRTQEITSKKRKNTWIVLCPIMLGALSLKVVSYTNSEDRFFSLKAFLC